MPGIGHSPDKVLQSRIFSYGDAHRYRLGAMRFDGNGGGYVNYEPNSFGGPKECPAFAEPALNLEGDADRFNHREGNDDYTQPGNIARHMASVPRDIQMRQICHFFRDDPAYGLGVAKALHLDISEFIAPPKPAHDLTHNPAHSGHSHRRRTRPRVPPVAVAGRLSTPSARLHKPHHHVLIILPSHHHGRRWPASCQATRHRAALDPAARPHFHARDAAHQRIRPTR